MNNKSILYYTVIIAFFIHMAKLPSDYGVCSVNYVSSLRIVTFDCIHSHVKHVRKNRDGRSIDFSLGDVREKLIYNIFWFLRPGCINIISISRLSTRIYLYLSFKINKKWIHLSLFTQRQDNGP